EPGLCSPGRRGWEPNLRPEVEGMLTPYAARVGLVDDLGACARLSGTRGCGVRGRTEGYGGGCRDDDDPTPRRLHYAEIVTDDRPRFARLGVSGAGAGPGHGGDGGG